MNKFEDFRIKVFLQLVRCGSFTSAAKELGVSQPAVSQNIAELEKTLGVRLFERNRSALTLTRQGEIFNDYARQIDHWYSMALWAVSSESFASESSGAEADPFCTLTLDNGIDAQLWSYGGDIHISFKKK